MKLIIGTHNIKTKHKGCVATIGNFDGVHLGHQSVLQSLVKTAQKLNLPSTVILFEPQPKEYFLKNKAPARLTRFREKIAKIKLTPIDRVLVLTFNQSLANLSSNNFIQKILINKLGIKYLLVGDDFKFGKNRQGNFETLMQAGQDNGFIVNHMQTIKVNNTRVSSTIIRKILHDGNLAKAKQLLGYHYQICGIVSHGRQQGRKIGFPTANISLHRNIVPISGVFAIQLFFKTNPTKPWIGVANVGTRPTMKTTQLQIILEIHLFNFDKNIYGEHVSVDFLHKIRNEHKFISFELLRQQITEDIKAAEVFFDTNYCKSK